MSVNSEIQNKRVPVNLIEKELASVRGAMSPFEEWLYCVKRLPKTSYSLSDYARKVTPELWAAWQNGAKADFLAKKAAEQAAYRAEARAEEAERRARLKVEAEREAAHQAHRARLAEHLEAMVIEEPELNPVDWQDLHKMKKSPDKAKRDIARRWQDRFKALPWIVQTAWMTFYAPITIAPRETVIVSEADDDDDTAAPTVVDIEAYVIPLPAGQRNVYSGNADDVRAGVEHPDFKAFMPFSAGVRRLLDLIGNPIDDVILPPTNPHAPQPALDIDAVDDEPDKVGYIVPGLIPRGGLTVIHADAKHCKSLFMQKVGIVVADKTGADFEGMAIDHGPVVYVSRDPGATREIIKPGVLAIRDRLGLEASGRLHVAHSPLVINEAASVEAWLALNAARLPCKLIVLDSLFSITAGSLAQDTVMQGVMGGVATLLRETDAVVAIHHDNKSGDIFGSRFLDAIMVSKLAAVRNELKGGVLGDRVTVTTEFLKFDAAGLELSYQLQGPFLALTESSDKHEARGLASRLTHVYSAIIVLVFGGILLRPCRMMRALNWNWNV